MESLQVGGEEALQERTPCEQVSPALAQKKLSPTLSSAALLLILPECSKQRMLGQGLDPGALTPLLRAGHQVPAWKARFYWNEKPHPQNYGVREQVVESRVEWLVEGECVRCVLPVTCAVHSSSTRSMSRRLSTCAARKMWVWLVMSL